MKVAIINPPSFDGNVYNKEGRCETKKGAQLTQPITIGIIAALMRKHHIDFEFFDWMANPISQDKMREVFRKGFDVAILNTTTPTFNFDKITAKMIKEESSKTIIAGIGTIVTSLPSAALEGKEFDIAVMREPEETVMELCQHFQKLGKLPPDVLRTVDGISFLDEGKMITTQPRELLKDLDELPFAARDLYDMKKYIEPKSGKKYTVIKVSRGCPYGCTFCTVNSYSGKAVRFRSAKSIIAEVEECITKYGIKNFFFLSDLFTAKRDMVHEFCKTILDRGHKIQWVCNSRVDTLDLETAKLMKQAGCWLIGFGVESGSQKILKEMKKGLNPQKAIEAAQICKETGIRSIMYYIFGFEGETEETIQETMDFSIQVDSDYARFFLVSPLPGSEIFDVARERGLLNDDWEDYQRYSHSDSNVLTFCKIPNKRLRRLQIGANLKYYLRRKAIMRLYRNHTFKEKINMMRTAAGYFKNFVIG